MSFAGPSGSLRSPSDAVSLPPGGTPGLQSEGRREQSLGQLSPDLWRSIFWAVLCRVGLYLPRDVLRFQHCSRLCHGGSPAWPPLLSCGSWLVVTRALGGGAG